MRHFNFFLTILKGRLKKQQKQKTSSVSWGCRIHQPHLCRRVRLPQRVSWIWHYMIWWWGFSNTGALGNVEYLFIAIAPRSTLAWSGSTWYGPIHGSDRTVSHLNCVLMLNWIVWNRTVYMYKNEFGIK